MIGVVTANIADNANGYVTTFGLVRDIDTSAYTAGDVIYLSQTAGQFTATPPVSPAHAVKIGHVIVVHATEGVILVDINTGEHLEELHDVKIDSL